MDPSKTCMFSGLWGRGEFQVKSFTLDKLQYKSLAFKDTWNPHKFLVSSSLRDSNWCVVLVGREGEANSSTLDRHTYQILFSY